MMENACKAKQSLDKCTVLLSWPKLPACTWCQASAGPHSVHSSVAPFHTDRESPDTNRESRRSVDFRGESSDYRGFSWRQG